MRMRVTKWLGHGLRGNGLEAQIARVFFKRSIYGISELIRSIWIIIQFRDIFIEMY
jgi:hypothetical protein